jgi:hypothetical protein
VVPACAAGSMPNKTSRKSCQVTCREHRAGKSEHPRRACPAKDLLYEWKTVENGSAHPNLERHAGCALCWENCWQLRGKNRNRQLEARTAGGYEKSRAGSWGAPKNHDGRNIVACGSCLDCKTKQWSKYKKTNSCCGQSKLSSICCWAVLMRWPRTK